LVFVDSEVTSGAPLLAVFEKWPVRAAGTGRPRLLGSGLIFSSPTLRVHHHCYRAVARLFRGGAAQFPSLLRRQRPSFHHLQLLPDLFRDFEKEIAAAGSSEQRLVAHPKCCSGSERINTD